jgi:hypothetical protein
MSQKLIFAVLKEARASDKTLHLVHCIYSQAEAQVRVNMAGKIALTKSFPVDRGSLQGDKLACMLYELGQAKLLIDNDPGRGKQRLCPNPRQPDWQCAECQVTSESEHVPSLNWRAGHKLSAFRRTCGLELADSSSRHMARSQRQTPVHAQMPQVDFGSKRHVLRRQSGHLHRSASEISSFSLLAAVRRGEIVYRLRAGGISPRTSPRL